VPWVPGIKVTDEDPSITDPAERERRFLQYDHVRLYGEDYPEHLAAAGFQVEKVELSKTLPQAEVERFRLPKDEPLYVCRKSLD